MSERQAGPRTPIAHMTTSLRSIRARTLAPRLLFYATVVILCAAGLRATLSGPGATAAQRTPRAVAPDLGAQSFAEGFARVYLQWNAKTLDERSKALETYLPGAIPEDGGLVPGKRAKQRVAWTTVTATQRRGRRITVSVYAVTSGGPVHLAVPVERDGRGFLYVAGYPALLGPPLVQSDADLSEGDDVLDAALEDVVNRAIGNYLSGAGENLRADLTPDAVVTLPAQTLRVTSAEPVTWVIPNRRVAVIVHARDATKTSWTLRYEIDVHKRDRWYVASIQSDPTKEVSR
jgi:Conjugative transposon protein TcpC